MFGFATYITLVLGNSIYSLRNLIRGLSSPFLEDTISRKLVLKDGVSDPLLTLSYFQKVRTFHSIKFILDEFLKVFRRVITEQNVRSQNFIRVIAVLKETGCSYAGARVNPFRKFGGKVGTYCFLF